MTNPGENPQPPLPRRGAGVPQVKYQATDQTVPAGQTTQFTFDADPVGGLPHGAVVFSGEWVVRAEPDAPSPPNALYQIATAEFTSIALSEAVYADVTVSVRFKPVAGRTDQAAGIIFRVQDKDNYYILRASSLERNVDFYKYAGGKRNRMARIPAIVLLGAWQDLRVEVAGSSFRGFLNNELVLEATDGSYLAGRIGLWTKGDSLSCFDDVYITAT